MPSNGDVRCVQHHRSERLLIGSLCQAREPQPIYHTSVALRLLTSPPEDHDELATSHQYSLLSDPCSCRRATRNLEMGIVMDQTILPSAFLK